MTYTLTQLVKAYTAVHDGIAPDAATLSQLTLLTNASYSDADALSYVINSADSSTALAALSYQFFTGKSPSAAGLDYLVNSPTNTNDLNDAYYAKFGLENRYINFAANLGVAGEGASAFATKYGAMSFADYVASIYETIIGASYAKAAGIDPAAAIASIVSRKDAILATAQSSGMIPANATAAQIDIALKAAAAGYLMGEAVKADVGIYAAAVDNFMIALAKGTATYNTDLTQTYAPTPGVGAQGTGHAVDAAPPATALPGLPAPPPPPTPDSYAFVLTPGADQFAGDVLHDTFTATNATFNAGDVLDGGDGGDLLTLNAATGVTYVVPAATVLNIETAKITNNAGVTVNTTGWTGLTTLNVADNSATTVTASGTTNVSITNTGQNNATIGVNGGHDVSVTSTTGGATIDIGATIQPTGAVVVDATNFSATGGTAIVKGGTSVAVTFHATNPVGVYQSAFYGLVTGSLLTSAVTLKGSPIIASSGSAGGNAGSFFIVTDANVNSSTDVGTITTLTADGFDTVQFTGTGLTTLTASHGARVEVQNTAATTGATTLNATLSGITNLFSDQNHYTTLNLTRGAEASSFVLNMNMLTTLNIGGAGGLTITGGALGNVHTLTVTGSGALDVSNAPLFALTTLDASTATGAITAQVDASLATVTTGSGADVISMGGSTISHAVSLGAGDDTLYLAGATSTITATVEGGNGTDTVWMDAIDGHDFAALYASHLTGFERVHFDNGLNCTVDLVALGGYHYVEAEDGAGFTINGFSAGDTLVLTNSATSYIVGNANFGGAHDSFNLGLEASSGISAGSVDLSGVETVAITVKDTSATPTGANTHSVTLLDAAATTITVSGDAGLQLTANSTILTSVDASGITLGDFTWTTGVFGGGSATVKGSAHGTNTFTVTAPSSDITYEGGTGDDIITLQNDTDTNVVHLGAGNNYFVGQATSVTAGAGDDYARIQSSNVTVDLGSGHNVMIATGDSLHYTGGSGYDEVFLAGGSNVVDVGSGNDYVEVDAVDANSATVFTSITGMGAGDKLVFASGAANNANAMGAQITLSGVHTLADYLAAASTDAAGTTNTLHWFVMGSDLYIVSDVSAGASFVEGADAVVKLVGAAGLASTMGATAVSAGVITFH